MLGRFVLTFVQVALGWTFAGPIRDLLPLPRGQLDMFLLALVFAAIFWAAGLLLSLILRDTARPSLGTLSASVVMGLAGAALTWIPPLTAAINGAAQTKVPLAIYPMAGALIGYMARR